MVQETSEVVFLHLEFAWKCMFLLTWLSNKIRLNHFLYSCFFNCTIVKIDYSSFIIMLT